VESSRELDQKRKGYRSILGVVNAMKALSGANLRKGASAVSYTRRYREFIESAASSAAGLPGVTLASGGGARLLVVFGSQFGFCGAFNARMVDAAGDAVRKLGGVAGQVLVGRRLMDQAAPAEGMAEYRVDAPGSVDGLGDCISELLALVFARYKEGMFDELYFLYPVFEDEVMHTSIRKVLPPGFTPEDTEAGPPLTYISAQEIMEGIIEEYLYIELYAAALEAVIAENEVRIRSMDFAARNIRKKLEELTRAYNYANQEEVTNELIEIISGYEAARKAAAE
jgi:F-type H+-transporting ATPase subunit gamma